MSRESKPLRIHWQRWRYCWKICPYRIHQNPVGVLNFVECAIVELEVERTIILRMSDTEAHEYWDALSKACVGEQDKDIRLPLERLMIALDEGLKG